VPFDPSDPVNVDVLVKSVEAEEGTLAKARIATNEAATVVVEDVV
jgi:hypothetical protein